MIKAVSIEIFKSELYACIGDEKALEEKFGDGVILRDLSYTLDNSYTGIGSLADELCEYPKEAVLILEWFLKQQDTIRKTGNKSLEKTTLNLISFFIANFKDDETASRLLVDMLSKHPQREFVNILFSLDKLNSSISRHVCVDEYAWEHLDNKISIILGKLLLLVEDEASQKKMSNKLIELSSNATLNYWLTHPLLKNYAYEGLKENFMHTLNVWRKECPDFLAQLEKDNILSSIGVVSLNPDRDNSLGRGPKKM